MHVCWKAVLCNQLDFWRGLHECMAEVCVLRREAAEKLCSALCAHPAWCRSPMGHSGGGIWWSRAGGSSPRCMVRGWRGWVGADVPGVLADLCPRAERLEYGAVLGHVLSASCVCVWKRRYLRVNLKLFVLLPDPTPNPVLFLSFCLTVKAVLIL